MCQGYGVRSQLCAAPTGPFRQLTPDPLTRPRSHEQQCTSSRCPEVVAAEPRQHVAAGVSPQTGTSPKTVSRGAAPAITRCRRSAAPIGCWQPFHGLTPMAKCCHRSAIQDLGTRFSLLPCCRRSAAPIGLVATIPWVDTHG